MLDEWIDNLPTTRAQWFNIPERLRAATSPAHFRRYEEDVYNILAAAELMPPEARVMPSEGRTLDAKGIKAVARSDYEDVRQLASPEIDSELSRRMQGYLLAIRDQDGAQFTQLYKAEISRIREEQQRTGCFLPMVIIIGSTIMLSFVMSYLLFVNPIYANSSI